MSDEGALIKFKQISGNRLSYTPPQDTENSYIFGVVSVAAALLLRSCFSPPMLLFSLDTKSLLLYAKIFHIFIVCK